MLELPKISLQMTTSTPCFCNVQYKIWPLLFNRMFSFKWEQNMSKLENIWLQSPIVMCWNEYCKSSTWSGSIVFPTWSNIFLFDFLSCDRTIIFMGPTTNICIYTLHLSINMQKWLHKTEIPYRNRRNNSYLIKVIGFTIKSTLECSSVTTFKFAA